MTPEQWLGYRVTPTQDASELQVLATGNPKDLRGRVVVMLLALSARSWRPPSSRARRLPAGSNSVFLVAVSGPRFHSVEDVSLRRWPRAAGVKDAAGRMDVTLDP